MHGIIRYNEGTMQKEVHGVPILQNTQEPIQPASDGTGADKVSGGADPELGPTGRSTVTEFLGVDMRRRRDTGIPTVE